MTDTEFQTLKDDCEKAYQESRAAHRVADEASSKWAKLAVAVDKEKLRREVVAELKTIGGPG